MDLKTKLLTLCAIFCVIVSAGVVCATDSIDDGGYAGINYEDANGVSGSQYYVNEGNAAGDAGQQVVDSGNTSHITNQTGNVPLNSTGNATGNTTGNATNHTVANATNNTAPVVANTTGNATNLHSMLSTGNPILLVLGASIVLGGYAILRRNN